jgi:hypothetical protein
VAMLLAMTTHLMRLAAGFHSGSVTAATRMTTEARRREFRTNVQLFRLADSGAESDATRTGPQQARCLG